MKMHYVITVLVNNEPIGFRRTFAFQTLHAQLKSAPGAREGAHGLVGGTGPHTVFPELGWRCPNRRLGTNGF